jgi:hypothetical protein
MFCSKCSEWIMREADWELHCQGNIDRFDIPLRCDPITFHYALANKIYNSVDNAAGFCFSPILPG